MQNQIKEEIQKLLNHGTNIEHIRPSIDQILLHKLLNKETEGSNDSKEVFKLT